MDDETRAPRDVEGALHGSRFVTLPHVRPHVERCLAFIAGDAPVPNANLPVLPLDDASAIADFVLGHCRLAAA